MYLLPLRYIPKNAYSGKFCYVYFTTIKKKKKANSQERAEQKIATEFWKLETLIVVGWSEKAQLQTSSGESRAPAPFHHRILQRLQKCCFGMKGWGSVQASGLELTEKQRSPHCPPFRAAGCLPPHPTELQRIIFWRI